MYLLIAIAVADGATDPDTVDATARAQLPHDGRAMCQLTPDVAIYRATPGRETAEFFDLRNELRAVADEFAPQLTFAVQLCDDHRLEGSGFSAAQVARVIL